jgi:hypothetical protein
LALYYKRIKNERALWVVVSYLIFDFLINIALLYAIPVRYHNKVYPVFTIVESLFFAFLFFRIIQKPRLKRFITLIATLFIASLVVYYYYTYFVTPRRQILDSFPIGIETILIFVFSFFYFYEQLNDTTNFFIYTKYSFWCVLAIVLYLAGSFFVYILANQISFKELVEKYWVITNIAVTLRNLFFLIAILVKANEVVNKKPANFPAYTLN